MSRRERIKAETGHYENVRQEVKLASGDDMDLKMYEPAMRHLLDTYIRAEESERLSAFDDLTLVQLVVERGEAAVEALPEGIRKKPEAMAETIENNVRRLIVDEMQVNPEILREDVGSPGRPDPPAQAGGDGLQGLLYRDRRTGQEGQQA